MIENRIYTPDELRDERIYTDEYHFNSDVGEFVGILNLKATTRKGDLRLFFTFEDGRKVIALAPWFHKFFNMKDADIGNRYHLTYEKKSGGVYLSQVRAMNDEDWEDDFV